MPGPNHGQNAGEKAKDFGSSIKKLLRAMKPFRGLMMLAGLLAVGGSICSIVAPNRLSDLVNEISAGLMPGAEINLEKIWQIGVFLIVIYAASAILTYVTDIIMVQVTNRFAQSLRKQIIKKVNDLPLSYFDRHAIGDTLSRITNDVDTMAQGMDESFATITSAFTLLVGSMIMMFVTNGIMAATAIGASLFGIVFMVIILAKSQKHFVARQKYLGAINGHIEETYSSLMVIKAYNGQKQTNAEFDRLNEKVREADQKSQFFSGLMHPILNFIGNFGYVAVCVVGALLTMDGQIEFGTIVAFIAYVRIFTSPLAQIGQAVTAVQSAAAASERVFEFLEAEPLPDESQLTKYLQPSEVKGRVDFENVRFTYADSDEPVIKHFSATAKPGQKVAIVGPTGAGKTTLISLLMKFYDIDSGDIKIDGVSIKDLKRSNVHDLFTMVLQDTWLFDGSIKDNIIYNRKGISDARVEEVCQVVGLDHFIHTLPQGFNTRVANNDEVSAGQRQLITIARGMITDTPFLILDEATSNVDTRTEELVQKAMDKLTVGRTSFIIAHRLSTIKNADLILVMRDGDIVEQGSHKQLMAADGFYAKLYNSQFEL